MADEEVQLGSATKDDDYEVVPVGPMRKLERRMDELEQTAKNSESDPELIRDVLDIMKSNQKVVNDMTESTHQLKNQVEDLTHKMDEVVDNMNSFMDLLKEASEMDMEGEVVSDMESRIAESVGKSVGSRMQDVASGIQESNQQVADMMQQMNQNIENLAQQNTGMRGTAAQQSTRQTNSSQNAGRQRPAGGQQDGQASQTDASSGVGVNSAGGDERMQKLRKKFEDIE
jgi:archaellum component FlaC